MRGNGANDEVGGSYSAVASLDLVHLMASCQVEVPPVAARSAIDYIAAFLGDGGCADLVRDCLRDMTGAASALRERLGPSIAPSPASDPIDFPGPMAPEVKGLAVIVSGRAAYLLPPGQAR
jgi:hypothetical protein